ncbi:glyoxylase-like metal-dependent hydrolase (beta-lactamase superfamily II) [Inquilinus ginsengisoli]|uniref:Glyoxylase-like metal-dependent hydrolase (Beta-lactamase superfamily II) n=1 Tax=Inquilinus ginsengisoli TaxID=363840 RepID=A0ABU1K1C8_9PROT|nr:MBL fold metallo-hydrolase [Inquilinus ginsengisoli]MDR6294089.1 glyoxylase-like metal-dependent hydrolase (beta-lactamase superfamily II) [Inquilinus ginsengisoli]
MGQDNTSHSGGPGYDELVPSRYALRVGEIDVMVVSDGIISISAEAMATNADPAVRSAWLHERLQPEVMDWALNEVVVRSGDRTILIDSGLGLEAPSFPKTGRWSSRLEAAGIDLADVTDVVLTHMHFDHVGGLLVDGVQDQLRPDVRIHASAAEAEFWQAPDFSRTAMPGAMTDMIRSAAKRFLAQYGSKLQTFETDAEVAPGVVVTRTGGHTPGHSVVRLASGGDRLTFVGDAVLPHSFEHQEWHNGFEHDPEEAVRVRTRLLRDLAASGEPLLGTHLPFPSICRVAAVGNGYRWVPALWNY